MRIRQGKPDLEDVNEGALFFFLLERKDIMRAAAELTVASKNER